MADELAAIRAGLAENLATIPGVQVSPYVLSSPTPPTIWVSPAPDAIEYHQAFGNGVEYWTMVVRAAVGVPTDIGAQKRLDQMLSSTGVDSVKAALESDKTLGGAALDLKVDRCSGYQIGVNEEGTPVLSAEWIVDIYMDGG